MSTVKQCEWCGSGTVNFIYRFIIEPEYTLYLRSRMISYHDHQRQNVVLDDGREFEYSFLQPNDTAIQVTEAIPHIFCSESCVDNFLEHHSVITNKSIHEKTPIYSFKQEGYFVPLIVEPREVSHREYICSQCGISFPNISKLFRAFLIKNVEEIPGNLNDGPTYRSDIILSDMSKENPNGTFYHLNFNQPMAPIDKMVKFCSNECSFDFSVRNNCMVMFKDNIMKGASAIISPFTKKINIGLRNRYTIRPHKLR
ncbi:MAG: hypothetical protein JJU13_12515 [Balneolaceae bacterium]|nr:hypothetical protein [Balneolaceae bacterium]